MLVWIGLNHTRLSLVELTDTRIQSWKQSITPTSDNSLITISAIHNKSRTAVEVGCPFILYITTSLHHTIHYLWYGAFYLCNGYLLLTISIYLYIYIYITFHIKSSSELSWTNENCTNRKNHENLNMWN